MKSGRCDAQGAFFHLRLLAPPSNPGMGHYPLLLTYVLCVYVSLSPVLLKNQKTQRLRKAKTTEPAEMSTKTRTPLSFLPHIVSFPQQVFMGLALVPPPH